VPSETPPRIRTIGTIVADEIAARAAWKIGE
jgi:hypothetical protein